jgi:peptidoglycan glycosyltransferase
VNSSLRKVALVLGLAFVALVVQLTYTQVIASRRFAEHPANRRLLVEEYSTQRGDILASNNEVLARSVGTDDQLKYLRQYPLARLFGEITGYYSIVFGAAGIERSFNRTLVGKEPLQAQGFVDDLLGRDRKGNTLLLTIDPALQRIAASKLGKQRGAAVAIDPRTGAILAMYSTPGYDPNPLSSHDVGSIRDTWERYNRDPTRPLISRAIQERYPPGSTFKVLVAAAALEAGIKPTDTFPNPSKLKLPLTTKFLTNFGGGACRGGERISFADGLRVSCNTTFAQIGLKIGAEKLVAMVQKFGLQAAPDFDLDVVPSCIRTAPRGCSTPLLDPPQTALSSIGQFDVRVTPLQMALVAATVANLGRVPHPYLVRQVQDFSGGVLEEFAPPPSAAIYSPETAETLKAMMVRVVEQGTGRVARIPGVEVGGKTGTAETGVEGKPPHAWFISFAPGVAVAVVVENGGDLGDDATGGKVAAPIALALMKAVLAKAAP